MTEDFKRDTAVAGVAASLYRLCRHKYAGTLHLTSYWWSDSKEEVLGTGALSESVWLDGHGRARLQVDLGPYRVRLQVLTPDARDCLTALTTYKLEDQPGHVVFERQIAEELAQEIDAMDAATRGMAVADSWLAVIEAQNLRAQWRSEMANRGFAGDAALDSPYHSAMPLRLIQQARRTWAAAFDGAKHRHAALAAEWEALKVAGNDAESEA
jgi:hypothetical protein